MATSTSTRSRWLVYCINIGLAACFVYVSQVSRASQAVNAHFQHVLDDGWTFPDAPHITLRRHYTGLAPLDTGLSFLVSAFLPAAGAFDLASWWQQSYFLISFFPVIAVMTVEASRRANVGTLMSYTSVWALFYQTIGGAIVIPLWFNSLVMATSRPGHRSDTLDIPSHVAKALLPALLLGYLLPTILVYLPFWNHETLQGWVAFWQPCPLYVNALLWLGSSLFKTSAQTQTKESASHHVRKIYLVTFVVSASAHLAFVTACLLSSVPRLTMARVLFPPTEENLTMTTGLLMIFQADFILIMTSAIWTAAYWVYSSPGLGHHRPSTLQLTASASLSPIVVGPGAALSAVMYLRESYLEKISVDGPKKIR